MPQDLVVSVSGIGFHTLSSPSFHSRPSGLRNQHPDAAATHRQGASHKADDRAELLTKRHEGWA